MKLLVLLATLLALVVLAQASGGGHGHGHPRPSRSPEPVKPTVFIFNDANIDDYMAIKLLLKYSNIHVAGLVPGCAGFCNMGPGIQNMFGLLSYLGREDVQVWAGEAYASSEIDSGNYSCTFQKTVPEFPRGKVWADTALGLNQRYPRLTDPTRNYYPGFPQVYDRLPQAIAAIDGPIIFLSLGTLTEIDYLFRRFPEIKQRVERIYIMGGAVNVPGNLFFPRGRVPNTVAECNIYLDPHSARNVFISGVPITLVPLDATDDFPIHDDFVAELDEVARTREATWVHALLAKLREFGSSISLWDPLAAGVLGNPSLIEEQVTLNMTVVIDSATQMGRTVVDNVEGKPVQVVLKASQNFYDEFIYKLNQRARY
jgi:inosine-uridine nucleoside N-ribohydrolase